MKGCIGVTCDPEVLDRHGLIEEELDESDLEEDGLSSLVPLLPAKMNGPDVWPLPDEPWDENDPFKFGDFKYQTPDQKTILGSTRRSLTGSVVPLTKLRG